MRNLFKILYRMLLLIVFILIMMIVQLWAFDCKYFSFQLPGNQNVKVGDNGVYVEGPEGKVYVDDQGVRVENKGNTNWVLIDNRDRAKKEGDYYVFYRHSEYLVNLKVTYYAPYNQFYNDYQTFINNIKSREKNVNVSKSSIPNDYDRTVYKVVVYKDNGIKNIFYTVSSDYGFYIIEFSGKEESVNKLSGDLKYVIDTFVPKY